MATTSEKIDKLEVALLKLKEEFRGHVYEANALHEHFNSTITKTSEDCSEIRTRLDKWNGSIPHIREKIDKISENMESQKKEDVNFSVQMAIYKTKLNLLLGILGPIGLAILGYIIKQVFFP